MQQTQVTSIIRDRGQLTIPDAIRKVAPWAGTSAVVSVSVDAPDEIIIRPHAKQIVDWDKIWKGIRKARAIKGKNETKSAVEFIAEDRLSH
jgi:bifunctional DNA-binding transcriptional regulator/antitoxin component of YhaV-PrlF toxin-antitoxin module